jgi:hypothetical protein
VTCGSSRSEVFRAGVAELRPSLSPGDLVLLDEACRLIDRSDRFDALLSGDASEWLTVEWPYEDQPARLVVSGVILEARATAAELRQIVKALDLPAVAAVSAPSKLELLLGGAG